MKLAVLCLVVAISIVYADEEFSSKFDNIDVDQILNNGRLLKRYVDCVLDKPNLRCPPEALELKKYMHEALETECGKCSPKQKQMIRKVIKYLILNKQDMWDQLKVKYDPEGKYTKKYEDMAREDGVTL